jgi:hypothetical protein
LISFIKHTTKTYNERIRWWNWDSVEKLECPKCYFCILMLYQRVFLLIFTWKVKGNIFGYLYTNQTYIFFSYEIAEFLVRVRLYYLYLPMDVCTFFLHIFNKKFWLQFICNKLISTTAHESVKIDLFTLSCADTSGRCRDCYK